jgi:hypothetical protein
VKVPDVAVIPAIAGLLTVKMSPIQFGSMLTFIDLLLLFELKILQLSNIKRTEHIHTSHGLSTEKNSLALFYTHGLGIVVLHVMVPQPYPVKNGFFKKILTGPVEMMKLPFLLFQNKNFN